MGTHRLPSASVAGIRPSSSLKGKVLVPGPILFNKRLLCDSLRVIVETKKDNGIKCNPAKAVAIWTDFVGSGRG